MGSRSALATEEAPAPLLLEVFRPICGPADRDGREDDHERNYEGVGKWPDQGSPGLAEDHGEQVLYSRVPGQGGHQPKAGRDQLRELVEYFSGHRYLLYCSLTRVAPTPARAVRALSDTGE